MYGYNLSIFLLSCYIHISTDAMKYDDKIWKYFNVLMWCEVAVYQACCLLCKMKVKMWGIINRNFSLRQVVDYFNVNARDVKEAEKSCKVNFFCHIKYLCSAEFSNISQLCRLKRQKFNFLIPTKLVPCITFLKQNLKKIAAL